MRAFKIPFGAKPVNDEEKPEAVVSASLLPAKRPAADRPTKQEVTKPEDRPTKPEATKPAKPEVKPTEIYD